MRLPSVPKSGVPLGWMNRDGINIGANATVIAGIFASSAAAAD
jgi:hypothetical protein